MDKIPFQDEYKNALEGDMNFNKEILKLDELNELAGEDFMLLINTFGKVSLGLVRNAKSADFPEGNCKIAWDRLVSKYTPHLASLLLKVKGEFHTNELELFEKDQDEWISNLEVL